MAVQRIDSPGWWLIKDHAIRYVIQEGNDLLVYFWNNNQKVWKGRLATLRHEYENAMKIETWSQFNEARMGLKRADEYLSDLNRQYGIKPSFKGYNCPKPKPKLLQFSLGKF